MTSLYILISFTLGIVVGKLLNKTIVVNVPKEQTKPFLDDLIKANTDKKKDKATAGAYKRPTPQELKDRGTPKEAVNKKMSELFKRMVK